MSQNALSEIMVATVFRADFRLSGSLLQGLRNWILELSMGLFWWRTIWASQALNIVATLPILKLETNQALKLKQINCHKTWKHRQSENVNKFLFLFHVLNWLTDRLGKEWVPFSFLRRRKWEPEKSWLCTVAVTQVRLTPLLPLPGLLSVAAYWNIGPN